MEFNLHNLVFNTTVRYTVTERIQSDTTRRRSDAEQERDARDPQENINTKRHPLAHPPAPRLFQLQYRPTID